jgi:hypothetical protein
MRFRRPNPLCKALGRNIEMCSKLLDRFTPDESFVDFNREWLHSLTRLTLTMLLTG